MTEILNHCSQTMNPEAQLLWVSFVLTAKPHGSRPMARPASVEEPPQVLPEGPNLQDNAGLCCKPLVDTEIEPGIAVNEPHAIPDPDRKPWPVQDAPRGPDQAVAVAFAGGVSCLNLVDDVARPRQKSTPAVEPNLP